MIDNNIIFRINDRALFAKDPEPIHVILTQEYDWLPCATPIVVNKKALDSKDTKSTRNINGHLLFPPRAYTRSGIHSNDMFGVPKVIVTPSGMRPIMETHRTLNINKFRTTKLDKVRGFVKEFGGVTFVVEKKGAKVELADALKTISHAYKYSSLFSYITDEQAYLKDDSMLAVISFFDLKYCVPLFNLKRVDGMAVSLQCIQQEATEKNNRLIKALDVNLVVSNYEDNLFIIDGVAVNPIEPIGSDIYKAIKNWIGKEPRIKDKNKPASKRQRSKQEEDIIELITKDDGESINLASYGNASLGSSHSSSIGSSSTSARTIHYDTS